MLIFRLINGILEGIWQALKPALRFIAWLFALVATIALVNDVTHWQQSGGAFTSLSVANQWESFAPGSFQAAAGTVGAVASWLWDPVVSTIIAAPVWFVFGLLGLFLAWVTRDRRQTRVFAN